jgi:RNA polymerase sigma factor (sigma-70 family)
MFSHLHKLSLMPPSNARSYLLASVKNIASSMISEDPSSQCSIISLLELTEDAVPDRTDLLNEICTSEASRQLAQAILSLPEDTQDVLYLYFVEFMNLREISAHLQLSYSTVSKRFLRGQQQLKKKIQKIGGDLVYEIK